MDTIGGIFCMLVAAFAVAGIIWPRVRGVWKGTQVPISTMTSIGFALIFGSVGAAYLWSISAGIPLLVGFLFVIAGQFWDFRRSRKH